MTRDVSDPFSLCPCGHAWMAHDIEEYDGDGSDTCCVEGCSQVGCPGRGESWLNRANEMAA